MISICFFFQNEALPLHSIPGKYIERKNIQGTLVAYDLVEVGQGILVDRFEELREQRQREPETRWLVVDCHVNLEARIPLYIAY